MYSELHAVTILKCKFNKNCDKFREETCSPIFLIQLPQWINIFQNGVAKRKRKKIFFPQKEKKKNLK